MDYERAAIKAIFYAYPIEKAYPMVVEKAKKSGFLSSFAQLAYGESKGYTIQDFTAYQNELTDKLFKRCHRWGNYLQRVVELPLIYAEEMLTLDGKNRPCVKYKNLFKWREAVKSLGEDLFSTSYLAAKDKTERTDFFWPNVISHNNDTINEALDSGLSDIHSHFGGGIDAFQFNWICLMNEVVTLPGKFDELKFSLNKVTVFDEEYKFSNLATWCRIAATIRLNLLKLLTNRAAMDPDTLKELLGRIRGKVSVEDLTLVQGQIERLRSESRETVYGYKFDYAISEELLDNDNCTSPNCIYAGERLIEYLFYREFLKQSPTMKGEWVELFYLYELIKSHVRREFVFANDLSGLEFYNAFKGRTEKFSKAMESISNIYSIQTGLREEHNDFLESRITSDSLGLSTETYGKSLFSRAPFMEEEDMGERLTFVVQLTKKKKNRETGKSRYYRKRNEIHDEFEKIENFVKSGQSNYGIVGLDVGGMEKHYRPEVYAHAIRAGKAIGYGVTYHVGEVFYDVVDGMRAVWEIIEYSGEDGIDRLGHCLALGTDLKKYYDQKHSLAMPKQILLDNVVWLCGFAKEHGVRIRKGLRELLLNKAQALYNEIGYDKQIKELSIEDYYRGLLLRSDDANPYDGLDLWSKTAELKTGNAKKARENQNAVKLNEAFNISESIMTNGDMTDTWALPKYYAHLVEKVQRRMLNYVKKKTKCIECCPSSNLQIGNLERYDNHPAIRYDLNPKVRHWLPFMRKPGLNCAICTDAKGVFATSLSNELSLMMLAAEKKYGRKKKIKKSFIEIVARGNNNRFIKTERNGDI